jgi:hypothetical protein
LDGGIVLFRQQVQRPWLQSYPMAGTDVSDGREGLSSLAVEGHGCASLGNCDFNVFVLTQGFSLWQIEGTDTGIALAGIPAWRRAGSTGWMEITVNYAAGARR